VRIDRTSGYDAYRLTGKDAAAPQKGPKRPQAAKPDVTVEITETARRYIDQALAAAPVDSPAVIEARKLLAEGLLDTPEAIDRAAQANVERGL